MSKGKFGYKKGLIKITEFSANAQALGYFYQSRYALYMLLESSPDLHISIEKLDDIAFEQNGTAIELIQTKHHLNSVAALTDSCSDLWKTIRVWSTVIQNGEVDITKVKFSLVTTGLASKGSIASKLYPNPEYRDVKSAVALLNEVAKNSTNQSNKAAYTAYLKLSDTERENLAHCIYILDSSPNITDTKENILKQLRYATRPQFQDAVFQRLEGIWFDKVINHLSTDSKTPISQAEISECISDLQEQFRVDNLPIDFLDCLVPTEEALTESQKVFVEQLKLVTDRKPRIQKAISDYYKAFGQRSRWIRDELLFITELETYEKRLVDEWERQFEIMLEDVEDSSDTELKKAGRSLFNWMDQEAAIHIRPLCTEPYVMRGSYHILSNEFKVGWHSQFFDRLKHMIEQTREAATR